MLCILWRILAAFRSLIELKRMGRDMKPMLLRYWSQLFERLRGPCRGSSLNFFNQPSPACRWTYLVRRTSVHSPCGTPSSLAVYVCCWPHTHYFAQEQPFQLPRLLVLFERALGMDGIPPTEFVRSRLGSGFREFMSFV